VWRESGVIGDSRSSRKHASSVEDLVVAMVTQFRPGVRPAEEASRFRVLSFHADGIRMTESAVHRRKKEYCLNCWPHLQLWLHFTAEVQTWHCTE
jgi:hypothetical protein